MPPIPIGTELLGQPGVPKGAHKCTGNVFKRTAIDEKAGGTIDYCRAGAPKRVQPDAAAAAGPRSQAIATSVSS